MEQLVQCENEFMRLKKIGCHLDALRYMELSLNLRKQIFGIESREVSQACKVLLNSYNTLAMNCLQREDFEKSYELLKKAETLTAASGLLSDDNTRQKLRSVTLNNLGVFYKRKGKLHAALHCVEKALKIELVSKNVDNPAGTHLNLCAILSQLGRHNRALEHACCALELLKQTVAFSRNNYRAESENADVSILAVAYHNIAVEQEFLSDFNGALDSYSEAVKVAEYVWGNDHVKTVALRQSLRQAHAKFHSLKSNDRLHRTESQTSISKMQRIPQNDCTLRLPLFHSVSSAQSVSGKGDGREHVNQPCSPKFTLPKLTSGGKSYQARGKFCGKVKTFEAVTDSSLISECQLTAAGSEIQSWAFRKASIGETEKVTTIIDAMKSDGRESQRCVDSLQESDQDSSLTMESNQVVRVRQGPTTPTRSAFKVGHFSHRASPALAANSRQGETHELSSFDDFSKQITDAMPSEGRQKRPFSNDSSIRKSLAAEVDHLHSVPSSHFVNESKHFGKGRANDTGDPSRSEKLLIRRLEQLERTFAKAVALVPADDSKTSEIKVKIDNNGDMRLIVSRADVSVTDLYDDVIREYGIHPLVAGGGPNKKLLLKYRDADGDMITLSTQPALDIAMEHARRRRPPLLLLSCFTGSESLPLRSRAGHADLTGCDDEAAVASPSLHDKAGALPLARMRPGAEASDTLRQHQLQRCAVTLQCALRSRSARKKMNQLGMAALVALGATAVDESERHGRRKQTSDDMNSDAARREEASRCSEPHVPLFAPADISASRGVSAGVETSSVGGGASGAIIDGEYSHGGAQESGGIEEHMTPEHALQMKKVDAESGNGGRTLAIEDAALVVSCALRCHWSRRAMDALSAHSRQAQEAASRLMIQNFCRNWLARRRVLFLRSKRAEADESALSLQCAYRGRLARLRVRNRGEAVHRRQRAAVTVQRWVRGHAGRRFARDARQAGAEDGLLLGRYQMEESVAPGTHSAAALRGAHAPSETAGALGAGAAGKKSGRATRSSEPGAPESESRKQAKGGGQRAGKDGARGLRGGKGGYRDGGRGLVRAVLVSRGEGAARDRPVRALDLKTKRHVLLRIVEDGARWEREKLLQSCLDAGPVAPLVDSFRDARGDPAMHVLGYLRPEEELGALLREPRMVSGIKMDVCKAVVAAVAYLHSRGVVMVHLEPDNVVRYGKDWKLLGLKWARRTGELLGSVEGLELVSTVPEVVAACAEGRLESVKASVAVDSWGVGSLMYLVQTGEALVASGEEARQVLRDGEGPGCVARIHGYLEGKIDKVEDVMAKYVVENLVCLDARDRMLLRDALLYAPQMGVVQQDDSSELSWMEAAAGSPAGGHVL